MTANDSRSILATDFGIWLAFDRLELLSDRMYSSALHWEALANYLLLYDQVVIPTSNLQVLPVLRLMLGEDVFDELLESRALVLARYDQWFAYSGGGGGLGYFRVSAGPESLDGGMNMGYAHFLPLDKAIDIALASTTPVSTAERRKKLKSLLLSRVVEIPLGQHVHSLTKEPYQDVAKSPYLRNLLGIDQKKLNHLGKLPGNKMVIFDPHRMNPSSNKKIQDFLGLAFENFVLFLANLTNATDVAGETGSLTLLRAKGQRFGAPIEGAGAFASIQELSGVPDLGKAFSARVLTPQNLLSLRNSHEGAAFRKWFALGNQFENQQEVVSRFVEATQRPSWVDSLTGKVIRLAATSAIGVANPGAGLAASAIDSFLISRWFPGAPPRLFMQRAKLVAERFDVGTRGVERPLGRNDPCHCGNGKKYKNCHGKN